MAMLDAVAERSGNIAGRFAALAHELGKGRTPQKMLQHLYRRGFSTAVCRAAVADFTEEEED